MLSLLFRGTVEEVSEMLSCTHLDSRNRADWSLDCLKMGTSHRTTQIAKWDQITFNDPKT